jgi:hypothetical protein
MVASVSQARNDAPTDSADTAGRTNADFDQHGRFAVGNSAWRGKKLAALYHKLCEDYGGKDRLTESGRLMVEQAARLKLRADRVSATRLFVSPMPQLGCWQWSNPSQNRRRKP